MGKWGHFTKDGTEYIVTRPDTPRPWINYLTNGRYCAICSHTGGGYSFVEDPGYNRITRAHPGDEIYEDRPGRYVYVHELETGKVWSLNWQPVQVKPQHFSATIGQGYTTITNRTHDLESEVTYFVPRHDDMEIWKINLTNHQKHKRTFRLYTYVELTMGNFHADLLDRSFENLFNDMWFSKNILYGTKTRWNHAGEHPRRWDKTVFMTANVPIDGYESSRECFLGQYHYLNAPELVTKAELPHHVTSSGDSVGILVIDIELKGGESAQCDIMLGAVETVEKAQSLRLKYGSRNAVDQALTEMTVYWRAYNNHFVIESPDTDFNTAVNTWNRYQCWVTSLWSEMASYYIPGAGVYGFRDEAQHIFGMLPHEPETVKKKLNDLLIHQFKNGMTVHNWDSYTQKGQVTYHSDDVQWLVSAILNYVKETGDLGYLEEKVPYYDQSMGTIFEHLTHGLDYTLSNTSKRGVSLRQTADWNDAIAGENGSQGESIMVASQVGWNIQELLPILEKLDKHDLVKRYREQYHQLFDAVNKHSWDGQWYERATTPEGHAIGSHRNTEGMIYLNAQSWPIIAGFADYDPHNSHGTHHEPHARGVQAMNEVWQKLMTPYGPALFLPPYTEKNASLGIVAQFTPGTKENGTIFLHPVAWSVIAECILGHGDAAYDIWQRSSFISRSHDPKYKSEPYVYPEYMYGPAHPKFGQGSYTWITGSAAWFYRACTDWILGIRPTLPGLKIDPCVPKSWTTWTVERDFRKARYHITVSNPHHICRGVKQMEVDGKIISGNLLPDFGDNKTHQIKITLEQ